MRLLSECLRCLVISAAWTGSCVGWYGLDGEMRVLSSMRIGHAAREASSWALSAGRVWSSERGHTCVPSIWWKTG